MADTASDADNGDKYRRALLRQDRSRKTREDIVRSAARLWTKQGFEHTTIAEICEMAGAARTTYYFHFANKDALLGELTWLTAQGVQHRVPGSAISLLNSGDLPTCYLAGVAEIQL